MGKRYEGEPEREIEADLQTISSRLGKADAEYRTDPKKVARRVAIGILIVIASAVFHFLVWTDVIPWPGWARFKFVIAMIAGLFLAPGVGAYLITFAVRGRKMCILVYPTGLFLWHRGRVIACPWDEIAATQVVGLTEKAVLRAPDGCVGAFWFDVSESGKRLFGIMVALTRIDGEQVAIPSTISEFSQLFERIQKETYQTVLPRVRDAFLNGEAIAFGSIVSGTAGLTVDGKFLPWSDLAEIRHTGPRLEIRQRGKKKSWKTCDLSLVSNPHVLFGFVDLLKSER